MADITEVIPETAEKSKAAYVDSHCHIDLVDFDPDRDAVVERARQAGVAGLLLVGGVDAQAGHRRALSVAGALGLLVSAGIHPHEARLATEEIYSELEALAR